VFNFIIIDDNRIDLMVATKAIEMSHVQHGEVKQFLGASEAIEFVKSYSPKNKTIVLIDIQMPVLTGFDFMEEFEKLPAKKKQKFICMFLSSSSNDIDRIRAQKFPSIVEFLNKPFTADSVLNIYKKLTI